MKGFRVIGAAEYGTGAVVDFRSAQYDDGAAMVLFVAGDRNWGIGRFGVITKPSIGTSDQDQRAEYERTVSGYLRAVRERDCQAFERVAFTGSTKAGAVCGSTFARTKQLARRMRADPSARPVYQGGNDTYGFYGLETRRPRPRNSTISVVRGETSGTPTYVVLDVASSPTAATRRRAIRLSNQSEPPTSPSRKAD